MQRGSLPLSLFFVCARPDRLIAEVERHTYFQLTVTYRAKSDYPNYATHTMSGRWPRSNLEPFAYKANALPATNGRKIGQENRKRVNALDFFFEWFNER